MSLSASETLTPLSCSPRRVVVVVVVVVVVAVSPCGRRVVGLAQADSAAHVDTAGPSGLGLVRCHVDPATLARPADQSDHITPSVHTALHKVAHAFVMAPACDWASRAAGSHNFTTCPPLQFPGLSRSCAMPTRGRRSITTSPRLTARCQAERFRRTPSAGGVSSFMSEWLGLRLVLGRFVVPGLSRAMFLSVF